MVVIMKIVDYIVNGTYKSVRIEKSVNAYDYIRKIEKTTFIVRRVIYE